MRWQHLLREIAYDFAKEKQFSFLCAAILDPIALVEDGNPLGTSLHLSGFANALEKMGMTQAEAARLLRGLLDRFLQKEIIDEDELHPLRWTPETFATFFGTVVAHRSLRGADRSRHVKAWLDHALAELLNAPNSDVAGKLVMKKKSVAKAFREALSKGFGQPNWDRIDDMVAADDDVERKKGVFIGLYSLYLREDSIKPRLKEEYNFLRRFLGSAHRFAEKAYEMILERRAAFDEPTSAWAYHHLAVLRHRYETLRGNLPEWIWNISWNQDGLFYLSQIAFIKINLMDEWGRRFLAEFTPNALVNILFERVRFVVHPEAEKEIAYRRLIRQCTMRYGKNFLKKKNTNLKESFDRLKKEARHIRRLPVDFSLDLPDKTLASLEPRLLVEDYETFKSLLSEVNEEERKGLLFMWLCREKNDAKTIFAALRDGETIKALFSEQEVLRIFENLHLRWLDGNKKKALEEIKNLWRRNEDVLMKHYGDTPLRPRLEAMRHTLRLVPLQEIPTSQKTHDLGSRLARRLAMMQRAQSDVLWKLITGTWQEIEFKGYDESSLPRGWRLIYRLARRLGKGDPSERRASVFIPFVFSPGIGFGVHYVDDLGESHLIFLKTIPTYLPTSFWSGERRFLLARVSMNLSEIERKEMERRRHEDYGDTLIYKATAYGDDLRWTLVLDEWNKPHPSRSTHLFY